MEVNGGGYFVVGALIGDTANQFKSNFGFWRNGKTRVPGEKPLGKEWGSNKLDLNMEEVKNSECCVAPGTSIRVTVPKRLDLCYYFGTIYTIHLYFDLNMSTDQDIERGSHYRKVSATPTSLWQNIRFYYKICNRGFFSYVTGRCGRISNKGSYRWSMEILESHGFLMLYKNPGLEIMEN